jgi:hypothetical protein
MIELTTTRYKKSIKALDDYSHAVLKESSNKKLARRVTKGKFKGYAIRTLTLTERATCPRSCFHWSTCYGNNMPFALPSGPYQRSFVNPQDKPRPAGPRLGPVRDACSFSMCWVISFRLPMSSFGSLLWMLSRGWPHGVTLPANRANPSGKPSERLGIHTRTDSLSGGATNPGWPIRPTALTCPT